MVPPLFTTWNGEGNALPGGLAGGVRGAGSGHRPVQVLHVAPAVRQGCPPSGSRPVSSPGDGRATSTASPPYPQVGVTTTAARSSIRDVRHEPAPKPGVTVPVTARLTKGVVVRTCRRGVSLFESIVV